MITACRNGKYITCNVSQYKIVDPALRREDSNKEKEDNEDLTLSSEQETAVDPQDAVPRSGVAFSPQNTCTRPKKGPSFWTKHL